MALHSISAAWMLGAVPGFSNNQTSLNPAGPMAAHIEHTFTLIFAITGTVYLLVIVAMMVSVWRNRVTDMGFPEPQQTSEQSDRKATRAVAALMGITVVLLFVMLVASFLTSRAIGEMNGRAPLEVDVYGHQWWWEVQYPSPEADKNVVTANEIHVPVGTAVRIHGTSRDVIHSFWAPNIHGKRDLMPGYDTDLIVQVDQPGRWRGQCAEFCGEQHAHMAFLIVAEPMAQYHAWLDAQAGAPPAPMTPQAEQGKAVFLSHACIMCHTVRGTTAGSRVGPDLTHVASRDTIGAGTLPNNDASLAAWVRNAQSFKPGCRMPPNPMSGEELGNLVAYLETLR
jgi:cytochrome c oxidase subunit 2